MCEELTRVLTDLVGCKFDVLTKQVDQLSVQFQALGERVDEKVKGSDFDQLKVEVEKLSSTLLQKADSAALEELQKQLQAMRDSVLQKAEVTVTEHLNENLSAVVESLSQKVEQTQVDHLNARVQALREAVDSKLQALNNTTKLIESLSDTITETVTSSQRPSELEQLREHLETLGGGSVGEQADSPGDAPGQGMPEPEVQADSQSAENGVHRRGRWFRRGSAWPSGQVVAKTWPLLGARLCQCSRRQQPAEGKASASPIKAQFVEGEGTAGPSSRPPPADPAPKVDDQSEDMDPRDILTAVLAIERSCLKPEAAPEADVATGLQIDRLVDEPNMLYCTCSSLESQSILSCLWAVYKDVSLENAKSALLKEEERSKWDADSEFKICRAALEDDPLCEEVVQHVLHAPWPFWDRDVLQRRWQLAFGDDGEGSAVVMRSVSDESILPEQPGRVRAFVNKAAFLFRQTEDGDGLQITVCSHLDIGGLVPQWAQNFLTRFAAQRAEAWKDRLREHCLAMASSSGQDMD